MYIVSGNVTRKDPYFWTDPNLAFAYFDSSTFTAPVVFTGELNPVTAVLPH